MSESFTLSDGLEVETFHLQHDRITRVHQSAYEDELMRENARVRANGGARSLSFGKMILQMSYAQYLLIRKVNPALADPDPKVRTAAWKRLARDGGYRNLSVEDR